MVITIASAYVSLRPQANHRAVNGGVGGWGGWGGVMYD